MNKMGVVIDIGGRTISLKEPVGEGTFQVVLPQRIDLAVQLVQSKPLF
jgi:hypothetical protein